MKDGKFEAEDIYLLLYNRFSDGRQWLCAREVGNTTGFGRRRLDFVAANCYHGEGLGIHAFEVKISKSDLRRELTTPDKHNLFFGEVDYYSIVAPDYVLDKEYCELVPKQWGIYKAIDGKGLQPNSLRVYRKPLALHDERDRMLSRGFAFELMRCMRSNGEFRNADEKEEQLKAKYDMGFQKGRESVLKGKCDYERLYNDQRERLMDALSALRALGVGSYISLHKDDTYLNEAMRIAKENEVAKNVVAEIQGYNWNSKQIHNLIDTLDATIAPLKAIVQNEKDKADSNTQGGTNE